MKALYVYDHQHACFECFRGDGVLVPYLDYTFLTVEQLVLSCRTDIIWIDRRTLEAYDQSCSLFGKQLNIGTAFRRLGEAKTASCPHYGGTALDFASKLPLDEQLLLRNALIRSGNFDYVQPCYLSPLWIHGECPRFSYPFLREGMVNTFVFLLQDALNLACSQNAVMLDGYYSKSTAQAVKAFQLRQSCDITGETDALTWRLLMKEAAKNARAIE